MTSTLFILPTAKYLMENDRDWWSGEASDHMDGKRGRKRRRNSSSRGRRTRKSKNNGRR